MKNSDCDKLWSNAVKARAGNRCEVCGETNELASHHFFHRWNKSVRYNIENGFCLCRKCHCKSSEFSAHLTPFAFGQWAIQQRGQDWFLSLSKEKNQSKKFTIAEMEEIYEKLNKIIAESEAK